MARTLVIGLTESGTKSTVNEDTFSLGGRVYPDMITGSEERSGKSSLYTQLYAVTHGYGGSGAGDLAGRIVQRTAMDMVENLAAYKRPELDFRAFCTALVSEAHDRISRQIKPRGKAMAGASLSLLLVDANLAYILNVGENDIFLFRNNKLMQPSRSSDQEAGHDTWGIGQGESPPLTSPLTMKQFRLRPGDIILLASKGFGQAYPCPLLAQDLASPDAFAATIRLAQIHSRQLDDSVDGTVMAIKVRDLELALPDQEMPDSEIRRTIYHNGYDEDWAKEEDSPKLDEPGLKSKETVLAEEEVMKKRVKKEKRRRNWKTFFLFLFLGFLIGMAVILLVWFLLLS